VKYAGAVGFDGARGVVTTSEFREEALPQRSHDTTLRETLEGEQGPEDAISRVKAQE
jgi:hypothetical protein